MSIRELPQVYCDAPGCDRARPPQLTHSAALGDATAAGWSLGVHPVELTTSYGAKLTRPGDLCPQCRRKREGRRG